MNGIPEEDLRLLISQLEQIRDRAFNYLYPGDSIKRQKTIKGQEIRVRCEKSVPLKGLEPLMAAGLFVFHKTIFGLTAAGLV